MSRRIHVADAINWDDPLTRSMAGLWLAIPGQHRGAYFRNLAKRLDGTLSTSNADWSTGRPSGFGAAYFNGSGGYVDMGNPTALQATNAVSLAATFKAVTGTGSATWQQVCGRGTVFSGWSHVLVYNGTDLRFYSGNTGGNFASASVGKDIWVTAVASYDGANTRLYYQTQGQKFTVGTPGAQTGTMSSSANFSIGRGHTNDFGWGDIFGGYVTGVALWPERTLTQEQAQRWCEQSWTGFPDVLNWYNPRRNSTQAAAGGFQAAWASRSTTLISAGVG